VNSSFKRLIAALAFVLPVTALVASPVMAATHHKSTTSSVHKTSAHKSHGKKTSSPTAS
jgi:hypothetical protein